MKHFRKVGIKVIPQVRLDKAPLITVLVQSDNNFDTKDISVGSLRFGPGSALPVKNKAVFISRPKSNKKDLLVFFWGKDAKIKQGDKICLTGETVNQQSFKGCLP